MPRDSLSGDLSNTNGTYDASTRVDSANLAALDLARRSGEIAVSVGTRVDAVPTGNIKSYAEAVSWREPERGVHDARSHGRRLQRPAMFLQRVQ